MTAKMKDRLKNEELDLTRRQERDSNNALLTSNLDKVVQEESKTNYNLIQVGTASH